MMSKRLFSKPLGGMLEHIKLPRVERRTILADVVGASNPIAESLPHFCISQSAESPVEVNANSGTFHSSSSLLHSRTLKLAGTRLPNPLASPVRTSENAIKSRHGFPSSLIWSAGSVLRPVLMLPVREGPTSRFMKRLALASPEAKSKPRLTCGKELSISSIVTNCLTAILTFGIMCA